MQADIPAYFKTWSVELLSRASRVRNLIGDQHWLSDGMHKEFLLQEFLARHLPSNLHIDRGFIRRLDVDEVSPEIDILITDPWRHTPIFREGGLQIAPPSAVVATIEVKSTYRQVVLNDALFNVLNARKLLVNTRLAGQAWSSIVFATGEKKIDAKELAQAVEKAITHSQNSQTLQAIMGTESRAAMLPNVIGILDDVLALISYDAPSQSVEVRAFKAAEASASLIFAQLFSFLRRTDAGGAAHGELDMMLEKVDGFDYAIKKIAL